MTAAKKKNYDRLIKECFWEYNFTPDEIDKLIHSDNINEQLFVFEKILANSTDLLNDMELFDLKDLETLVEKYVVPTFNYAYLARRKNIVEYYFFDKPLEIEELKWVA